MNKLIIPYEKLSKKRRREIDNERRGDWGDINPVTKRPERPDAYKRHEVKRNTRKQARRWQEDASGGLSFRAGYAVITRNAASRQVFRGGSM